MGPKQKSPQLPDPIKTADAQTKSNIATAAAQSQLNNVNQVDAFGNKLTYTSTVGANGVPSYTATQTLSPAQQALLDTRQQTQQTNAQQVQDTLSQPFSLDNDATEARLMELGMKRLQPQLDARRQAAETDLINRGIRPGSTNYGQAHDILNQGENDAFDQLALTGRQQAVSEALAQRNQPLYEQAALAGSPVQSPQYASTSQTGVGGTDIAGQINSNYTNQLNSYNKQQSDLYGGLFGLGSAAIGLFSDERLKKNIRSEGGEIAGVPIKSWEWKGGDGHRETGVIAQEVERKHPSVVDNSDPSGFKKVRYGQLMSLGRRAA